MARVKPRNAPSPRRPKGDKHSSLRKDIYASYVAHPRYGTRPTLTGLNPDPLDSGVFLHWHSPAGCRISWTAVAADLSLQAPATIAITHYFDVKRVCRECERPFIFFAREQKHWYEELGFGLDSDCASCPPCRKAAQGTARLRQRYEELFHVANRSADENLEMADCCLGLVEKKVFHRRQLERVRALLGKLPEAVRAQAACVALRARLAQCEDLS